jgi:CelD/BcsL family acetyltransferase involved in cellulose biosynthesis
MRIESHTSSDIFSCLQPEWNRLLQQSPGDTLFLTWEFQKTWWEHFNTGCELRVLTARDDAGQLLGIAPLYLERDENGRALLRLIGGIEVADYLDFIVPADGARDVLDGFIECICRMPDWHALDLRNIPAASSTREHLAGLAAPHALRHTERIEEVCPIIPLGDTFDAYLESLDKKQRHEIRRKVRKAYAEAEVKWYCVGAEHSLSEAVDRFVDLHQKSKQNKDEFMTPGMIAFFQALAKITYEAGWLELAFIDVNGKPAATYFDFAYRGMTLCYNSGYDPQAYAALSPGIVLLTELIEHAVKHQRKCFDFLQGNETYKYRMGAQDSQVFMVTLERNTA